MDGHQAAGQPIAGVVPTVRGLFEVDGTGRQLLHEFAGGPQVCAVAPEPLAVESRTTAPVDELDSPRVALRRAPDRSATDRSPRPERRHEHQGAAWPEHPNHS